MARSDTADRLLDVAEALVQRRGFNAFSYRDLAAAVEVTTASIHYHFPAKADLGRALLTRYTERLDAALAQILATTPTARGRLERFVGIHADTAAGGDRICLCGSMAADVQTLPDDLRSAIQDYFARCADWVADVVRAGRKSGEFDPQADAHVIASTLVSGLQGALLQARTMRSAAPISFVELALDSLLGT